jgi:hypothetical protein
MFNVSCLMACSIKNEEHRANGEWPTANGSSEAEAKEEKKDI